MKGRLFYAAFFGFLCAGPLSGEEPNLPLTDKPQWQRMLEGGDAKQAAELQQRISAAEQADSYDEAIGLHKELLALRTRVQGADHWETASERWEMGVDQTVAALPAEERAAWRSAHSHSGVADQLEAKGQYVTAQPMRQAFFRCCEKVFGEKHPYTAWSCVYLAGNLNGQGKYAEAQPLLQKAHGLIIELLGEKHPGSARSYSYLAISLDYQGKYTDAHPLYQKALDLLLELLGKKHPDTATSYNNLAANLHAQGKYPEAQPLYQKALELRLELLGEKHPDTATSYNSLAMNLHAQGKYAEAQPLLQKTLELRLELLGEKHPEIAVSYNNLAMNLHSQGTYGDAQPLYQKALDLILELLGKKHPDAATSYNNLAANLHAQGKYAEAQPLYQKALGLRLELLGEKHPDIALSYNNLAMNLHAQGKYAEAQPLYQKALGLRLELLGERAPHISLSYNNLAMNLHAQGKHAEAQPLLQKALDLRLEWLGEKHPDTLISYNNLAFNLIAQRKYAEAQSLLQKALDLLIEFLGETHPHTIQVYNNLAGNLYDQGEYAEAQPLFQKALDLRLELLGEKHPDTAISYCNLAASFDAERRYADAEPYLVKACAGYEAARLMVSSGGLERAVFGAKQSPYRLLAVTQAYLRKASAAWYAVEADTARGLSDETAAHCGATFTHAEQERRNKLRARYVEFQPAILQLVAKRSLTKPEEDQLDKLHFERRRLEAELAELAAALSQREVATLEEVQAAIPPNAALMMWVDSRGTPDPLQQHWGCVVRNVGQPAWERLTGTGTEGSWTSEDNDLPNRVSATVGGGQSQQHTAVLVRQLYAQRIAPLEKHLHRVNRLYVVPVGAMSSVPAEIIADKYTLSYVPSGTFLARMKERSGPISRDVLVLGDPVFPSLNEHDLPLPPGGLLITHVVPGGNAAQARLQAGDALLKYAGVELASVEEFGKLVGEYLQDNAVRVLVWRNGEEVERELRPGKLGVVLDRQPAPQAIAAKRETDKMLLAVARGGDWNELPGTAVEVNRLRTLAGDEHATVLTRSAACEQELEQLHKSGKLEQFRYLHFATHGEPNNAKSFESALILSQDNLSKDIPIGGGKYYDGRLTANEVLENWKLNADLVTLSSCESALGRPGGGDGLLGFAQAFLLAGARSVCLSLWKVDDTATALLMDRFYQNLLGKRDGLSQPMPKAEALAEAKRWLRDLTFDEATELTADLSNGVSRGNNEPALKLVVPATDASASKPDDRPFAHPRYWAAFILIGDPN